MAGNFLTDIVTPAKRKALYGTYSAIGLLLGCVQAALGAVDAGTPNWLRATLAVYAFCGTAIGATAASNTSTVKDPVAGTPA